MNLRHGAFLVAAMLYAAITTNGAIIARGSYEISLAGRSSGEVGYDVDADGLIDFYLAYSFLSTHDVPSSVTVSSATFSQRTGFAFLKTANPFPQLQSLPSFAEIGPAPSAGQWESQGDFTSTISYAWLLYTPADNGYNGTFRGLEEASIGYRLNRDGETFYGALQIDLYQTLYISSPEGGEAHPAG